jgi:TetR/AcrR family tetracycline transcriptional repressor
VARPSDPDLDAQRIVSTAVDIFEESGLDAVSMRSVASRLGVSPVPLYSRVGNKEALIDAIADRLLVDLAPTGAEDESWEEYAARWARALRARLRQARDSRLILSLGRSAYVEASVPVMAAMRSSGFAPDAAMQACRILMWAVVGFGAVETGVEPVSERATAGRPGGDPQGVDRAEIDALFDLQIGYVIEGIAGDRSAPRRAAKSTRRQR